MGIMIPFIGTTLGAFLVFFMKNNINEKLEKVLLGFASGVMIAASVWSLLIPAIEMTEENGGKAWFAPALGFLLGFLFLIILDRILKRAQRKNTQGKLKKNTMLFLAVTIHNLPEGMAVGVVFAGLLAGGAGITYAAALSLAIGIAIQNFPEGAIISLPLKSEGVSKKKAFSLGVLSGVVEPIGAGITILLTNLVVPVLPYILAFAAGAMIYVAATELIPECQGSEHYGTVGVALGFTIMMILDVALG